MVGRFAVDATAEWMGRTVATTGFDVRVMVGRTDRRPPTTLDLTPAQAAMVEALPSHGGLLHRWSGGLWTYLAPPRDLASWPEGVATPEHWLTSSGVNSLLRKGVLVVRATTVWGTPGEVALA